MTAERTRPNSSVSSLSLNGVGGRTSGVKGFPGAAALGRLLGSMGHPAAQRFAADVRSTPSSRGNFAHCNAPSPMIQISASGELTNETRGGGRGQADQETFLTISKRADHKTPD
jgi:hypothetical protein